MGQTGGIETSQLATGWAEPNDRTSAVDAALVRCCRAVDSVAVAYRSSRDGARLDVETASNSSLRWVIGADGTWTYLGGEWVDEYGRVHRTTLMRPTLRGIARAAGADHQAVLEVVVRDVELAVAAVIETAEALRRRAAIQPPTPEALIERTWPTLSAADRAALWKMTNLVDAQGGTTLMVRDERGRDVLFLLDGFLIVDTGRDVIHLAPGSVVGERAALGDGVRSATVETMTDCVMLAASGKDLENLPQAVRDQLGRKVLA